MKLRQFLLLICSPIIILGLSYIVILLTSVLLTIIHLINILIHSPTPSIRRMEGTVGKGNLKQPNVIGVNWS